MKYFATATTMLLATMQIAAAADDYYLQALSGSTSIIVWKSKEAHDEALSLINAGVHKTNRALVDRLVACWVKPGTRVIVTDMGFLTHDIMVVEGPKSGCRGNIPAEELGHGTPVTSPGPGVGSQ